MAGQTKAHPIEDFTAINYCGTKPLTFFEIDFGAAANAEVGPNEAIQKCLEICSKNQLRSAEWTTLPGCAPA